MSDRGGGLVLGFVLRLVVVWPWMRRGGAVRLLAGLPWSLSRSWARSSLLRICWPQQFDRGLIAGG